METMLNKPSFYAHILNAILLFTAFILVVYWFPSINRLDPFRKISLILAFSLVIGIHGLSHMGLEYEYKYNPLSSFGSSSTKHICPCMSKNNNMTMSM